MGLAKRLVQRLRRRGRFWWIPLITLVLGLCQLCSMFGLFSPIYYGSTHAEVAPAGWQNITPRGDGGLASFDASTSSPGLMVACTVQDFPDIWDFSTWPKGGIRFWLSHDGGATWRQSMPPVRQQDWCAVSIDLAGAIIVESEADPAKSRDAWTSYDQGRTWRRGEPQYFALVAGNRVPVELVARRGDLIYGAYKPNDGYSHGAMTVSADGGTTWNALGTAPSQLERQGWKIEDEFIPDYRSNHWWYRTLATRDQIPAIEQSKDDGQTWTTIGPIGTTRYAGVLLAVNSLQPGHLCSNDFDLSTDHVVLLSSEDGGGTWNPGIMPVSFAPNATSGEYIEDMLMDGQGSCYQGYHFGRGGPPGSDKTGSYVTILRLPASGGVMQPIPVLGVKTYGNAEHFSYVPGGNGMPAHLIAWASFPSRSWTVVLRGWLGEVPQVYATVVP